MENIVIQSYNPNPFFHHYFKHDESNPVGDKPEEILLYIKPLLPKYIDTIINFGSANGRDFIPFQDDFYCIGFDLADPSGIEWVCKTDKLTYYQCSIEDFLDTVDHSNLDFSTCLIYTQGTLMYLSKEYQNRFIQLLLDKGCKNIIFHEYPPEYAGPHTKFDPDGKYLDLFEKKYFRPELTGFIILDKNG